MTLGYYYFEEAHAWARRAARNDGKADMSCNRRCRRTMLAMAAQADALAGRAALLAAESAEQMQSKSGLHPYRAGLFFILLEQRHPHRTSRQARAALLSDNIAAIADWPMVRMLAHQFDKTARAVARDLADTYRALEDGAPAP
jgi:hypothetical protein